MSKAKKGKAKAGTKTIADAVTSPVTPVSRLQRMNKWLAIAYGVQALAILLLSAGGTLSVTARFLGVDALATQANGTTVYAPATQQLFTVQLPLLLAFILAIPGAFHSLYLFRARKLYEDAIARRENPYRWLENAFSSSLLPVVIGLLAGMRDIASLAMLFMLGFTAHLVGWQYERQLAAGQKQDARRSYVILVAAGLTACLAVGSYLVYSALLGDGIPLFLGVAYGLAFAGVSYYGWLLVRFRRGAGRWSEYDYAERMFSLTGFAIKTLLVWLLFAGALQP